MDRSAVPLTFGFELELVVGSQVVLAAAKSHGRSKVFLPTADKEVYAYFAKQLTKSGCEAEAYLPTSTRSRPDYTKWNFTNDSSIVEDISSMEGSPDDANCRVGMELVSPIFRAQDNWESAIRNAMASIDRLDIRVNSTTGFHVHIGLEPRDLNVDEIKRIAQYVIIFESAFDQFVDPKRLTNDDVQSNRLNPRLKDMSTLEAIHEIEDCQTIEEVIMCMCSVGQSGTIFDGYSDSKLFKVNFTSLIKCGTIEFRQHGGTTDVSEIVMWVKVLLGFCSAAMTHDSRLVTELAENSRPLDTLFNCVLQSAQLTEYYLKRMGIHDAGFKQQLGFETYPIFLYGTLMSVPLLSLILTGDQHNVEVFLPLQKKAKLTCYRRGTVLGKDYPALVPGTRENIVEGVLFYPRNMDDRKKLNNFEGEQYTRMTVEVLCDSGQKTEATAYVWSGETENVSEQDWDFDEFEMCRLADWLDLFDGFEFT